MDVTHCEKPGCYKPTDVVVQRMLDALSKLSEFASITEQRFVLTDRRIGLLTQNNSDLEKRVQALESQITKLIARQTSDDVMTRIMEEGHGKRH